MERWLIKNNNKDFINMAKDLGVSEIVSKVLTHRNIDNSDKGKMFLNGNINKLYSPNLMKDLEEAGGILKDKIDNGKSIRIVGDYDVDGVMSIHILYKSIKNLGGKVDYVIPDRVRDGYGINKRIVEKAKNDNIDTIITCDNGITALEEVELAKELGLTIIITDHHDLSYIEKNNLREYIIPKGDAVIDPKNPNCKYPFKSLCGAGVVFKLVQYLNELYNIDKFKTNKLLEYVAIATICDVVDLIDENRIIVKYGLELINSTKNIGLKSLIQESKIEGEIGVYHIGFIIGPSINASGRLDTAYKALELLICEDNIEANNKAKELRELNEERKSLTEEGIENIINKIEESSLKDDKVLVIYEPSIHESIAGIIAGRIKDIYYKPTIVLTKGREGIKGSGRSIDEYNIFEELNKCKDLFENFGGHPMAAGLTLKDGDVDNLRKRLNSTTSLTNDDLIRKVYIDLGLPIEYINYDLIDELSLLEPFGKGNSRPIFGERNLKIKRIFKLGANKNVLKLILESKKSTTIDAMIFNNISLFEDSIIEKYGEATLDKLYKGIEDSILVDIIYYPSINEYMNKTNIQIIIQNYRFKI